MKIKQSNHNTFISTLPLCKTNMVGEFNSAKSGFPLEWSISGRILEGLGFKFLFPFHKGTSINNMLGRLDFQE
jgi:hypothetical protein